MTISDPSKPEITSASSGYNPISLETMSVKEWLDSDINDSNIVMLFRNQIYLIDRMEADEIFEEKQYLECSQEDNTPLTDTYTRGPNEGEYMYGPYLDFKDIGIPDLVCEKSSWDKIVMSDLIKKSFVIIQDQEYPEIKVTPVDKDNCEGSRNVAVGLISSVPIVTGGRRKKRKNTRKMTKKRMGKKSRKSNTRKVL